MWTVEQYVQVVKDLLDFSTNKGLSYAFYAVLLLMILMVDMNYIMHYFLGSMILVMLYNHPSFKSWVKEIVEYTHMEGYYKRLQSVMCSKNGSNVNNE